MSGTGAGDALRGGAGLADLASVAHRLADAAAVATLRHFRQAGLQVDSKDGAAFDPVTEADRAAERAMRDILARDRPGDAILGEEFAATAGETGLTWVLDPIDGTRGYVAGTPTWGTLIAVRDARAVLFGLIDQPYIGERFAGGAGRAVLRRAGGPEGPIGVRDAGGLSRARLFTTFPEIGNAAERAAFDRVAARVEMVRYGMDCYAYALLAAGQIDLVIEAGLKPHDIAGPIGVIEAAGGIVTDWEGGPVVDGGRAVAAGSRAVHAAALACLAGDAPLG